MTRASAQLLKKPVPAILLTGFVAGLLDITAACIQFYIKTKKDPAIVLRYVASGVFGKEAFTGDRVTMSAWGLLFHFMIAFGLTLFFYWLYPRVKWIGQHIVLAGVLYAFFAWAVTTQLIIPMSRITPGKFDLSKAAIAVTILIFCIGLPIALMINKHYLYKK